MNREGTKNNLQVLPGNRMEETGQDFPGQSLWIPLPKSRENLCSVIVFPDTMAVNRRQLQRSPKHSSTWAVVWRMKQDCPLRTEHRAAFTVQRSISWLVVWGMDYEFPPGTTGSEQLHSHSKACQCKECSGTPRQCSVRCCFFSRVRIYG